MKSDRRNPPKLALRFFRWFCHPDFQEDIEGDLLETFEERVDSRGYKKASWSFLIDVLQLFRPAIVRSRQRTSGSHHSGLFSNYLKLSLRNLVRNKGYSIANISGLTIGLVGGIFILLYVLGEMSYDKHFTHHDDIYRVALDVQRQTGEIRTALTVAPLGQRLKEDIPEVTEFATFTNHRRMSFEVDDKKFIEPSTIVVSNNTLKVLDFNLKYGDPEMVFRRPNSILISENRAIKYFGSLDVIGQIISLPPWGDFEVNGVLTDPPLNAHIQPQVVIYLNDDHFPSDDWDAFQFYNYILIKDGTNINAVEDKLAGFYDAHLKEPGTSKLEGTGRLFLQKITDIHLYSDLDGEHLPNGDIKAVMLIAALGFFIILVVCINYLNMSTTQAVKRTKEIGIRSLMGSTRSMLRTKFLFESSITTTIALIASLVLIILLMPSYNDIANKNLAIDSLFDTRTFLGLIVLMCLVGIAGGAYPGIVLSRFNVSFLFRRRITIGSSHIPLGKVLNAVQFVVAIVAVTLTVIIYNQMNFIRAYDLGSEHSQIIKVDLKQRIRPDRQQALKEAVLSNPHISHASLTAYSPGNNLFGATGLKFEGQDGKFEQVEDVEFNTVDEGTIPLLGIEIIAGRNFRNAKTDSLGSGQAAIINESLARSIGFVSPEGALGKYVKRPNARDEGSMIIGVVKDFHHLSLHHQIRPMVLINFAALNSTMLVKVSPGTFSESLAFIDNKVEELTGSSSHETTFLDQDFWKQYQANERQSKVLTIFSLLTLFIALLGLASLVSYRVELKAKEMTVRKVFGARLTHIFYLFAKEYFMATFISLIIAIPIAIVLAKKWLTYFAYRIDLGYELFMGSSLLITLLVILIIYFHSRQSFSDNPVKNLLVD